MIPFISDLDVGRMLFSGARQLYPDALGIVFVEHHIGQLLDNSAVTLHHITRKG